MDVAQGLLAQNEIEVSNSNCDRTCFVYFALLALKTA